MGFMSTIHSICVYCGSSPGREAAYCDAGYALGAEMARNGLRLVYGGGTNGIMGAVARGVIEGGGRVTGIIPRFLINREGAEDSLADLDELIVTDDMHARKHRMFEKSDAFVALPGGIGTVEEIVEIMTWGQLGRHRKPMLFANINGFWNPMLAFLRHMEKEGFLHSAHLVRPMVVDRAEDIVPALLDTDAANATAPGGDADIIGRL